MYSKKTYGFITVCVLIFVVASIYSLETAPGRSEIPCSDFANISQKNIPARCLSYWSER